MISLLNIPKLNFIVFELVKIPILTPEEEEVESKSQYGIFPSQTYQGESLSVVTLDILPTSIEYNYGGKKSYIVGYGDKNNTVFKAGNAPIRVNIFGTFGQKVIDRGFISRDGFDRLKEFRKLFWQSLTVDDAQGDIEESNVNYIYGVNYYDFTNHIWGSIDFDKFKFTCDARTNTQLPSYNTEFTILGDILRTDVKDPILNSLKLAIKTQDYFDKFNDNMLNAIKEEGSVAKTINDALVYINFAQLYASEAISLAVKYSNLLAFGSYNTFKELSTTITSRYLGDLI